MPKFITIACFIFIGIFKTISAQISETDSLLQLIKISAEDTNKVNLLWKTGVSIIYQYPQKAIPYFKQGTALALKLNFTSGIEKCYNATSLAFSFNAKYDSALIYINLAVPYAIKAGNNKRLALAYLNRADVYSNLQNYQEALKSCDSAIIYAEKANNNDGLGRIYSIMNDIYTSLNQIPKAFESLDKSDAYFAKVNNQQMIAMNYSERGDLYLLLNQPEKAISYFKKAIPIADSLQDNENLSAYNGSLAEAYAKTKRFKEAEITAHLALGYSQKTSNVMQQGVSYDNLSNIEMAQNNFAKAIEYGIKAYRIFIEENDLMRQQGTAANLAAAFRETGNTEQAYHYLQISSALNDSLVKQRFTNETAKLQTSFEVKQKDKEIELLNKNKEIQQGKLQKQRLLAIGAIILSALSITGIWLFANRSKLTQQMKELQLRNQIAADLHDEVGGSLSSITMLSRIVADKSETGSAHQTMLTQINSNARETVDKMSDIVWMIKPGENEGESMRQRMERFLYEICGASNIQSNFVAERLDTIKLNIQQKKDIYLIFKEAVNNSVKYSGTSIIHVTAKVENKKFTLIIKDEGAGFDLDTIQRGNGIDNMLNRAKDLNGSLLIDAQKNAGTTIQLIVPV